MEWRDGAPLSIGAEGLTLPFRHCYGNKLINRHVDV